MKARNVLIGTLAGLAAGAVLGILYAPNKGSITRRKISRKTGEYADELKETMDDLVEEVTDKFHTVIKEADNLTEKIRNRTEKILHKN